MPQWKGTRKEDGMSIRTVGRLYAAGLARSESRTKRRCSAKLRRSYLVLLLIMWFPATTTFGKNNPQVYFTSSETSAASMEHGEMHEHWTAPREAAERPNPVPADRASLLRGKALYQRYCVACHGRSGRGDGPAGATLAAKPSNLREMAKMHAAGDLAWKIANGRGPMPAWKKVLTEHQIWDLVNFIQNLGIVLKNRNEELDFLAGDQNILIGWRSSGQ